MFFLQHRHSTRSRTRQGIFHMFASDSSQFFESTSWRPVSTVIALETQTLDY